MPETYCDYVLHHGSRYIDPEPDETCDREAVPGTSRCTYHQEEE